MKPKEGQEFILKDRCKSIYERMSFHDFFNNYPKGRNIKPNERYLESYINTYDAFKEALKTVSVEFILSELNNLNLEMKELADSGFEFICKPPVVWLKDLCSKDKK